MAIPRRYKEQMPFVATKTQKRLVKEEADRRGCSEAAVIRDAIDQRYGLDDGLLPGETHSATEDEEALGEPE